MGVILDSRELFWEGFLQTLRICFYGGVGAVIIGTFMAALRVSPVPVMRGVGASWVTVFRNCPLTVVLFFMAFGVPEIGINGTYFWFGVTALALYTSAFVCEAVRSGINAIPSGQAEAARSLGLTFTQTLRLVVLPQALRTSVPPVGNVLIAMVKNSAIVGAFGVGGDLFSVGQVLTSARGIAAFPVLTGVALCYLAITIPSGIALNALERKVAVRR